MEETEEQEHTQLSGKKKEVSESHEEAEEKNVL